MPAIMAAPFAQHGADGSVSALVRALPVETAVSIEVNGLGHAVMMASPADLEDFALGFALGERLVDGPDELRSLDIAHIEHGIVVRLQIDPDRAEKIQRRQRSRVSDSACGLCGVENLEQALPPLPPVTSSTRAGDAAIFAALASLKNHQPLNAATGAMHGAALCDAQGNILLLREDVGRHNAFDKLIGAMARQRRDWQSGFALLTSRCSCELVEKAALANCPLLVTISVATSLAVARARAAGLPLIMLARPDTYLSGSPADF
jgi:FdhD protein